MAGSELRQTFRRLARQPGFTAVAVASLALGIATTAVMFSIVNGVLLRPLSYRDPDRLYTAQMVLGQNTARGNWPVNARHFSEWRSRCVSCESVAMVDGIGLSLTGEGEPERLPGVRVSYNFFETLGVHPAMGRDFRVEEELPGRFGEVILTDALWRNRFGGDPHIIGRKLTLNGEPHEVVGVMPASLRLPKGAEWGPGMANPFPPVIFRPLGMNVSQGQAAGSHNYTALVRLKPSIPARSVEAELNGLLAQFAKLYTVPIRTVLIPMQDTVTAGSRSALWLLLGSVGTLLLMVCVNVGNLMLLRTAARSREVGIRTALGSGRGRLFGLVLQEAATLVALGTGVGWLIANAGLGLFRALAPVNLPRLDEVQLDGRTLAFVVALATISTFVCGLFPAWRLTRMAPLTSLKTGALNATEGGAKFRLRELLVSVEVALSALLLIVGSLFTVSFYRVMQADRGIETAHVVTQDIALIHPKYAQGRRDPFLAELLRRLREIPTVESAGLTTQLPLRGGTWTDSLRDGAVPAKQVKEAGLGQFRFVSAGFAEAIGIHLRRGRFFEESDSRRPVAMLSESAAQMLWPNQNPIGHFIWASGMKEPIPLEVVGVVGAVRAETEASAPPTVYTPSWTLSPVGISLALRTRQDPTVVTRAMRDVLRSMDPELPIPAARTMEQILDESLAVRRFETKLVAGFAVAALVLALIGVYGVLAFSVARRTPEMGIRLALGSPAERIIAMVVRQGMAPVLIGLAAGVAGALALGRVIASQLYEVTPRDPMTIGAVMAALLMAGLIASYLPARRAAKTDPLRALRFE